MVHDDCENTKMLSLKLVLYKRWSPEYKANMAMQHLLVMPHAKCSKLPTVPSVKAFKSSKRCYFPIARMLAMGKMLWKTFFMVSKIKFLPHVLSVTFVRYFLCLYLAFKYLLSVFKCCPFLIIWSALSYFVYDMRYIKQRLSLFLLPN